MKRSHRQRDVHSPEVDLPITPMLDMFFQILFFFVMTYHPSALEGQFPIDLSASQEQGGDKDQRMADAPKPEITTTQPPVTVIAKATSRGMLESLEVTTFAGETEIIRGAVGGGEATLTTESAAVILRTLEKKLKTMRRQQEEIQKRGGTIDERVLVRVSPVLRWEETMRLLDTCRRGQDRLPLFPKIEMDLLKN